MNILDRRFVKYKAWAYMFRSFGLEELNNICSQAHLEPITTSLKDFDIC